MPFLEHRLTRLRKFSLEYCDLPTMVANVAAVLRVLTLNIDTRHKKGIPFYYYILTVLTGGCFFYVFMASVVWFVFVRCMQTKDMIAAMVIASLGIAGCIGSVKLLYMFVYVVKIRKIADDFLEYDSQVIPESEYHVRLRKLLRMIKKRAMMYWLVITCNGCLYLLVPFSLPGRNLPENYMVLPGLEPMFESPTYEIACGMMSFGVFFYCYVPACVTTYLIVVAGYTESTMLALSEELRVVWPDCVKKAQAELQYTDFNPYRPHDKIIINKHVGKRLKEIITRHAQIRDLFRRVEDIFRGAIALGFVFLVLGLITELLGKLENTYLQTPYAIIQIAIDCFTGQRVMDASDVFEEAVYDCQWENFDYANMKLVQVMLQNSQKTVTLSAGGLAMLSFSCLMSIMKGIYSTYTALRSSI